MLLKQTGEVLGTRRIQIRWMERLYYHIGRTNGTGWRVEQGYRFLQIFYQFCLQNNDISKFNDRLKTTERSSAEVATSVQPILAGKQPMLMYGTRSNPILHKEEQAATEQRQTSWSSKKEICLPLFNHRFQRLYKHCFQ